MNEIYWITRFGTINHVSEIVLVISLILLIVASFIYLINVDDDFEEVTKKVLKYDVICLITSSIFFIFVPTTKEALLIWGVGGTVNYIKSNPTAKQLPDKCINALDKWVDSLSENNDSIK